MQRAMEEDISITLKEAIHDLTAIEDNQMDVDDGNIFIDCRSIPRLRTRYR